jgi:hypothetical protein
VICITPKALLIICVGAFLLLSQAAAAASFASDETANATVPVALKESSNATAPAGNVAATVSIEGGEIIARTAAGDIIESGSGASAVIQAAVDAVPAGGVVEIREGTYTISDSVLAEKSVTLRGIGNPTLKSGDSLIISATGSQFDEVGLAADPSAGTRSIAVSDASGLEAGDLVIIYDDTKWNPWDAGWYQKVKNGEMHLVESVSGNTITVKDELLHGYSSSKSARVQFIRPVSITVDGIEIIGGDNKGGYTGISLRYTVDSVVRNCHIENAGNRGVMVMDCYETLIT